MLSNGLGGAQQQRQRQPQQQQQQQWKIRGSADTSAGYLFRTLFPSSTSSPANYPQRTPGTVLKYYERGP